MMCYPLTFGPRDPDEDEEEPFDDGYVWEDDVPFWDFFGKY